VAVREAERLFGWPSPSLVRRILNKRGFGITTRGAATRLRTLRDRGVLEEKE